MKWWQTTSRWDKYWQEGRRDLWSVVVLLIFLCCIAVNNIPILWSCGDSNCTAVFLILNLWYSVKRNNLQTLCGVVVYSLTVVTTKRGTLSTFRDLNENLPFYLMFSIVSSSCKRAISVSGYNTKVIEPTTECIHASVHFFISAWLK